MEHNVYQSLNKPLTLLGVERTLFFVLLILSYTVFHLSTQLFPAIALFLVLLTIARAATEIDNDFLRVLLKNSSFAARYDPAKYKEGH